MNTIYDALLRFSHRHWLTIDRGRAVLLTVLWCKAPMVAGVLIGLWAVIKLARMKAPPEYSTWK